MLITSLECMYSVLARNMWRGEVDIFSYVQLMKIIVHFAYHLRGRTRNDSDAILRVRS